MKPPSVGELACSAASMIRSHDALPGESSRAQAYDGVHGLEDFTPVNFAGALRAIDKGDRELADAKASAFDNEGHLDQEAVAAAEDGVEVQRLQHAAAITAEAGGAVACADAEHRVRQGVGGVADQFAEKGPANHCASGHVAAADHQIIPICGHVEQVGQAVRAVAEVGVHRADVGIALLNTVAKACSVGGAKPQLAGAMQHVHPWIAGSKGIGDGSSAVGRGIINDQHMDITGQTAQALNQPRQVLSFVVSGHNDQRPPMP